jgi:AcrR family transcriptional regulator
MGIRLRRQQERQARWEQIVDAASTVFSKKGFYQATIEDIERESNLTRGAIYYHFHSKEEIYISVLIRGMRILREELGWAIHNSTLDPETLILSLIDTYCDYCRIHNEYFRILDHFYSGWDCAEGLRQELVDEVNRLIYDCLKQVVEVIDRGKEEGIFTVENPLLEAVLMWSMVGNSLRKTTDNPRAAFLGIDWNMMQEGLKQNIIARLRGSSFHK